MVSLVEQVNALKMEDISSVVDERCKSFKEVGSNNDTIFSELCFCLLTANYQAEKSILMQKELSTYFVSATEAELAAKLKERGHRFWPQRAQRIVMVRDVFPELLFLFGKSEHDIRDWIVSNVHGLGMKEASHFLRNIGYTDVAIIDFHIVDLLVREGLIERPKTITKRVYLEIEEILREFGREVSLNLAELDLYLWYLETGKVLK